MSSLGSGYPVLSHTSILKIINLRNIYLCRSINIEKVILDCDDEDDDNYQFTEVVIKHRLSVEGRADSVEKECEDMDQHPADEENKKDSMCIDERSNGTNMPLKRERVRLHPPPLLIPLISLN